MIITDYLGLRYDITCIHGVNCWSLVALVYKNELDIELKIYAGKTNSTIDIADQFRARLAKGDTGFIATESPKNYDLVLFVSGSSNKETYHIGVYYNRKVLHANGKGRKGSVWYDKIKDIHYDSIRFLTYAPN